MNQAWHKLADGVSVRSTVPGETADQLLDRLAVLRNGKPLDKAEDWVEMAQMAENSGNHLVAHSMLLKAIELEQSVA